MAGDTKVQLVMVDYGQGFMALEWPDERVFYKAMQSDGTLKMVKSDRPILYGLTLYDLCAARAFKLGEARDGIITATWRPGAYRAYRGNYGY